MRRALLLLLAGATLLAAPASAARPNVSGLRGTRTTRNQLLRVNTPALRGTVPAHPFVNIIVYFGKTSTGAGVDVSTFRAHLGRADITKLFVPIEQNGNVVGMRAAVDPPIVRTNRHANNHLRLTARSVAGGKGKRGVVRDVDRIRFKAIDADNQPPVVHLDASDELSIPGAQVKFDASRSTDPESDLLTYQWDFGNGDTDAGPSVARTFSGQTVTATLTVSDGQLSSTSQVTLVGCPAVDDGKTPGLVKVDAGQALEMGAVPVGTTAARTFTVRNRDDAPSSQLKVDLRACQFPYPSNPSDPASGSCVTPPEYSFSPSHLDLGPGESADVTVTFAPGAEGHRGVEITALSSASNRCAVRFLGHAYGGNAAGTGPTFAAHPLFYLESGKSAPSGIFPNGARFTTDDNVSLCQTSAGTLTGDLCVASRDCPANNTCSATPGELEPIDFCGDGSGGLFIITDDGTYTEPNPGPTERSVTIGHIDLDGNGNRTGVEIFARTTTETSQIACDELAGGRVYAAEFHNFDSPQCFRDSLETLTAWRKNTGASQSLLDRIDAVEGAQLCDDDIDSAQDLEVVKDGSAVFAAVDGIFAFTGGLYRIWPSPLLMTPDINDFFQVHPDGSVLYVAALPNTGARTVINLYKITQEQAVHGAPLLAELAPCASFDVANNGGRTFVFNSFAADRAAPGSNDAVVIASFRTTAGGTSGADAILSPNLVVQGTVAFSSPAGATPCGVIGLENLELLDQASF
jgi:hypothetical protein